MAEFPKKSVRRLFLQQVRVRIRRLMREGFREFLVSMALAAIGTIFIDVYIRSKVALDHAMRDETAKIVGSREEPTDSIQELGLVATALAKVNSAPDPPGWACPAEKPACVTFEKLVSDYVESAYLEIAAAARKHLSEDGEWVNSEGEIERLMLLHDDFHDLTWPELRDGSFCDAAPDHTFLMVPAQMSAIRNSPFSPRLAASADVAGELVQLRRIERFLKRPEYTLLSGSLVQAYFISPDSLLRIWNPVHADLCWGRFRFPKTRLWAAKNYFSRLLENDSRDQLSTRAYIDYGGNGLVRTGCHVVQLQRDPKAHLISQYPRGHFLGIFCMDFKLPPDQVNLMRHQLFFEAADVTFPVEGNFQPDQLIVKAVPPRELNNPQTGVPKAAPNEQPLVASDSIIASRDSPSSDQRPSTRPEDGALDESIEMQGHALNEVEVRNVVYQELEKVGEIRRTREILRIPYPGNKNAFLLPLGVSGNRFQALFFFPRSPRLPLYVNILGIIGFLCAGSAVASLAIYRRFHSQIGDLRERMSLLRSLQAGVIKAKPGNELTECNDRAEELCGRTLPKPGVRLNPPVNYEQIFELFVKEMKDGGGLEEIKLSEIEKLRDSGKASAYYARVRNSAPVKWVFVRATPIMEPERVHAKRQEGESLLSSHRKVWHMTRRGSFVTVTDACQNRVETLRERFK